MISDLLGQGGLSGGRGSGENEHTLGQSIEHLVQVFEAAVQA
jgi:hypothetical protein